MELHRIPAPGKIPVLLMHGMLDSSATWILLGPDQGLGEWMKKRKWPAVQKSISFSHFYRAGYILYNLGYDVWLGNARGNTYSKGHVKYNRYGWRDERKKYWNFSWHEIGKFDLPASIDYIIGVTGYPKMHYIGWLEQ